MAPRLAHGPSRDNLRAEPSTSVPSSTHRRTVSSENTPRPSTSSRYDDPNAQAGAMPSNLLPPRTHSRMDSNNTISTKESATSSSLALNAKASPSKALSSARTYDPKLISREMHRLGSALVPTLLTSTSAAASSISLPQAIPASTPPVPALSHDPWHSLHVHLLPLFNREPLRVPIEDLNLFARKHIGSVVSSAPHKALQTLEADILELFNLGMLTLESRLKGPDDTMISRVVDTWRFFWDTILAYLEGAMLPMQTDPLLASLQRKNKPDRSGGRSDSVSTSSGATHQIDVRTLALRLFRDKLILPNFKTLVAAILQPKTPLSPYEQKRLQQMVLILTSHTRSPPPLLSLTEPAPPPSAGDQALSALLRALRSPNLENLGSSRPAVRAPSFLSSKVPRDRRGRIAGKPARGVDFTLSLSKHGAASGALGLTLEGVEEGTGVDSERQIDAEFLEALRTIQSPTTNTSGEMDATPRPNVAMGSGGWGLGAGDEGTPHREEDDEGDDYTWDSAQAAVEKMVGMKLA